jgi:hypothetical protein
MSLPIGSKELLADLCRQWRSTARRNRDFAEMAAASPERYYVTQIAKAWELAANQLEHALSANAEIADKGSGKEATNET